MPIPSVAERVLVHITVAIARFIEILLFDIARAAAGLIVIGLLVLGGCVAAIVTVLRAVRRGRRL